LPGATPLKMARHAHIAAAERKVFRNVAIWLTRNLSHPDW